MEVQILPSSMLRSPKGVKKGPLGLNWQPIFCFNCGSNGGYVPELPENCNFAFHICNTCNDGPLGKIIAEGYYVEPDAVFWDKIKQAQLEQDGRELSIIEVSEALKDSTHYLSKLATERDTYLKRSIM